MVLKKNLKQNNCNYCYYFLFFKESVINEISELKRDQRELKNTVEQLVNQNQEQKNEIELLKAKNEVQEKMYRKSKEEVRQLNLKIDQLITKEKPSSNNNNAIHLVPTNCNDLKQIGYSLNGFYPVKNPQSSGSNNNNMRLIFCNFGASLPDRGLLIY